MSDGAALRIPSPTLARVADELETLCSSAKGDELASGWFGYAYGTAAQLRAELASRGYRPAPRIEDGCRVVVEVPLADGRLAELTYQAHMSPGSKPEPSNGWLGGADVDELELVRVTVGDVGVPFEHWKTLVPDEASDIAETAADALCEELSDMYREERAA